MGDSITEGTVLELTKNIGDYVEMEEVVATVETDKVTIEIRSPAAGTLTALLAKPEDTVLVGGDFMEIDVGVGTAPSAAAPAAAADAAPAPTSAAPAASAPQAAPSRVHPSGRASLINFARAGAPEAPPAPAPPAAASPAPTAPPVAATKGETVGYDDLPARFQRRPLSAEEMEAVDLGGAGYIDDGSRGRGLI